MKVLWLTNTLFPDVCKFLQIKVPVVGGWMFSSAKALILEKKDLMLGIAALYDGETFATFEKNGIKYYLLPRRSKRKKLFHLWHGIRDQFEPSVVHIHGTEYEHGLTYIKACGNKNVAVSIQGLVSIYERYYLGGINTRDLVKSITLRDLLKFDTIFKQKRNMRDRGILEKELISSAKHIIGRTSWDKAHIWALNPQAKYHFCNETLRDDFYEHTWKLGKCEKYSIFLSQAHYPIKGLQQVIKALPFIVREFPDTKVYVAGNDFFSRKGLRKNGFGNYITSKLKKTGMADRVIFTGLLSRQAMCERYLLSHVFVCPSSIENSPNSVGEAQLLGTPCVASNVGGTQDMICDEESGLLYRYEEVEMLAYAICKIFSDDLLAKKLSIGGKAVANKRHDKMTNAKNLLNIYNEIAKS